MDEILKLNTKENKIAIQSIYEYITKIPIKLSDIRINDKTSITFLFDKPMLRWDRHYHYPNKKYHVFANYLYLKSIEKIIEHEYLKIIEKNES